MSDIERLPPDVDMPYIGQLMEYRDLMINIVRQQGRYVRHGRIGERARTRVGTEYMLPGTLTDWSAPDKKFRTFTERERRYSASYRPIGEQAGRLLVLESDSVLVNPDTYGTKRNIYRFTWGSAVGVSESEVLPIEIYSSTQVDGSVLSVEPYGIKDVVLLDQEQTSRVLAGATDYQQGEYSRYINPFRDNEYPWEYVNQADFDGLLHRTIEFSHDLLGESAGDDIAV